MTINNFQKGDIVRGEVVSFLKKQGYFKVQVENKKFYLYLEELPDAILSIAYSQFVGQELPVMILDGEAVSYKRALQKGEVTEGLIRAVLPGQILVEHKQSVYEIKRKRATRSAVTPLQQIYVPGDIVELTYDQNDALHVVTFDPWENGVDFERGDYLTGTVINQFTNKSGGNDYILIEAEPGLVAISDVPLRGQVSPGDRVNCYVQSVNPEKHRLKVRLRRVVG